MALVRCPECGKMISEHAKACIGCGRPKDAPAENEMKESSATCHAESLFTHTKVMRPTKYFVRSHDGTVVGPFTYAELHEKYKESHFSSSDYIQKDNSKEFIHPSEIFPDYQRGGTGALTSANSQTSVQVVTAEEEKQTEPCKTTSGEISKKIPPRSPGFLLLAGCAFALPGLYLFLTKSLPSMWWLAAAMVMIGLVLVVWAVIAVPADTSTNIGKLVSWKPFMAAVAIAFLINIVGSAITGQEPRKNIWWTVMWIYFSIEAWKLWKWKALLPYPSFILMVAVATAIFSGNMKGRLTMPLVASKVFLNIGGLIVFFLLLRRSERVQAEKKISPNQAL